ncbi:hypothetical protein SAMN04515618_12543 [Collimonas sp. OK307]|nr:hypothetical protein SAMN04515618_12543 [Collimonas sp. OK307]
MVIRHNL